MIHGLLFATCVLTLIPSGGWAQQSPPAAAAPKEEPQPPTAMTASKIALGERGFLEFHGLLQTWFLQSLDERVPYLSPGTAQTTFLIRRSEIKLSGQIVPEVSFEVMIDPSRLLEFGSRNINVVNQDPRPTDAARPELVPVQQPVSAVTMLQDASITFKYIPKAHVSIGQGHTPISREGLTSSSELLFVERAEVSRIFGDQRDIGAWVGYRFDHISYHVGVYNGAGASKQDTTDHQDIAARLEFSPVGGLWLGGSVQRTLAANGKGVRTVTGGDLAWQGTRLRAQGESYWEQSFSNDDAARETRRLGGYAALGYMIGRLGGEWQAAARVDWFDPNRSTSGNTETRITAGLNLLLQGGNAKLQLNGTHTQAKTRNPATGVLSNANNDVILLNAQVAF